MEPVETIHVVAEPPKDVPLAVTVEPAPAPAPTTGTGWLSQNLVNVSTLVLLGAVIYLAYAGSAEAIAAVITTFVGLVSWIAGGKASLKIPGRDR